MLASRHIIVFAMLFPDSLRNSQVPLPSDAKVKNCASTYLYSCAINRLRFKYIIYNFSGEVNIFAEFLLE